MVRRIPIVVAVVMGLIVGVAATVAAGDRFTDVPDTNPFHTDIAWLADTGVTRGCNPPLNDRFCPGDPVTREQMAAFLHRLAAAGVVDAATADHADTANSATTAGDADTLDGIDSAGFLTDDRIVLSQMRGWTHQFGGSGAVQTFSNLERLTGSDLYYLGLTTPNAVGGQRYYLDEVEVCYNAQAAGDRIDSTAVLRLSSDNNPTYSVSDPTDRTAVFPISECYTIDVVDQFAPESSAYTLQVSIFGAVRIIRVTSTFVPAAGGSPLSRGAPQAPTASSDPAG